MVLNLNLSILNHWPVTTQDQLENAQHRLSEKDDVIKSLQRQLNMSRSERETQVNTNSPYF